MAVTPWLLVVFAGARREANCRDAGHGEGLDQPTSSASSFSPSRGGLYSEVHTILRLFALDKHRDSCFGGLLAASCEVPLPFSRHWIFPSLEDQCKIDPRSRAASSSPRCAYFSTFPLCPGGTTGNIWKDLEKIPGVLLPWLCKNISAYRATQRNANIFTHSSGGLNSEF